jgi:hypothetical protein
VKIYLATFIDQLVLLFTASLNFEVTEIVLIASIEGEFMIIFNLITLSFHFFIILAALNESNFLKNLAQFLLCQLTAYQSAAFH